MIDITKNGLIKSLKEVSRKANEAAKDTKKGTTKKVPDISILEKIRNDPKYTPARSADWFKRKIDELGGNAPTAKTDLLRTTVANQTTRFMPGCMYMFRYMPKHAAELPYYDMFPCSLMFGMEGNLVRGINWHYLPIPIRARLFDKIWQVAQVYRNNQQQSKRITWRLLSSASKFPEVRPAVRSYLLTHIQSKLIKVDIDDWKPAMLLPVETFAKQSMTRIHVDSRRIIKETIRGRR